MTVVFIHVKVMIESIEFIKREHLSSSYPILFFNDFRAGYKNDYIFNFIAM